MQNNSKKMSIDKEIKDIHWVEGNKIISFTDYILEKSKQSTKNYQSEEKSQQVYGDSMIIQKSIIFPIYYTSV